MYVWNSGDVSLEGASFSECTAGVVRLPRPHTLASTAHARSHAIEPLRATRPLSLSDALAAYAFAPQLAQYGGAMYVGGSGDVSLERASFVGCTSGSQAVPRAPSTRGCRD